MTRSLSDLLNTKILPLCSSFLSIYGFLKSLTESFLMSRHSPGRTRVPVLRPWTLSFLSTSRPIGSPFTNRPHRPNRQSPYQFLTGQLSVFNNGISWILDFPRNCIMSYCPGSLIKCLTIMEYYNYLYIVLSEETVFWRVMEIVKY